MHTNTDIGNTELAVMNCVYFLYGMNQNIHLPFRLTVMQFLQFKNLQKVVIMFSIQIFQSLFQTARHTQSLNPFHSSTLTGHVSISKWPRITLFLTCVRF